MENRLISMNLQKVTKRGYQLDIMAISSEAHGFFWQNRSVIEAAHELVRMAEMLAPGAASRFEYQEPKRRG